MNVLRNMFRKKRPDHEQTDIRKRFELIGRVGQGSMSRVWRTNDSILNRMVALKVLDKEKTRRFESRFLGLNKPSEGEIATALKHPNLVQTLDHGWTTDDEQFLVMEFVEGNGLSLLIEMQDNRMRRYRLSYLIQIGEALSYFHREEWIHRDICPRNILVTEANQIKLIDFGLVVPNTSDFRKPGNRTGTANYMAPELIKRQPTDHRLDLFSYAVTCYEMYSQELPWDAALTLDAVVQHINKPPRPIKEVIPNIDDQVAAAIMRGLESQPDDRWQSAADMVTEFREAEARLVAAAKRKRAGKTGKPGRKKKPVGKRPGDTSRIRVGKPSGGSDSDTEDGRTASSRPGTARQPTADAGDAAGRKPQVDPAQSRDARKPAADGPSDAGAADAGESV